MEKEPLTLKLFGRTISVHHMDENHTSGDDAEKPRGDHEAGDEDEEEERRKKREEKAECPRCKSMDTKFCYYNNYNVNQPRHYCRKCQRYWTSGGALRNVPIGAGRRKHKAPQHPNYSISPCVISASNPSVFSQPMSVYTSSSQVYLPNLGSEGFPINVHNMGRKRREACPPQSEPVEGVICDASSSNSSSFVLSFSNNRNLDGSIRSVENDKVGVQMMKRPKEELDIHCNDVMKNQLTLNCGRVSSEDDPTCSNVLSFSLTSENSGSSPSLSTSCSRVFSS